MNFYFLLRRKVKNDIDTFEGKPETEGKGRLIMEEKNEGRKES